MYRDEISEQLWEMKKNPNLFLPAPLLSFSIDMDPITSEMAKVSPLYDAEARPIYLGMTKDPLSAYKEINEKARRLGLDVIREELIKQVQNYLDNQKSE